MRGSSQASIVMASAILVLALISAWWLIAELRLVSPAFLPRPQATFQAIVDGTMNGRFLKSLGSTTLRMVQGWLLSSLVGIALGALIGMSSIARAYLQPTIEFLRPLPASAIIPVAIAFFGIGPDMAIMVIVFGSIWPTLLATIHGFTAVEPRLSEVADCLQISKLGFVFKIGLPSALPDILGGMRLSITIALALAIICEMIAAQEGLGTLILLAARSFQAPSLFAGIVFIGLLGVATNVILELVELRLVRHRRH